MVDRLRAMLDHPLDSSAARAILALASAILVAVAGLFGLAAGKSEDPTTSTTTERASSTTSPTLPTPVERIDFSPPFRRQDPQDVPGSTAARRAARALASHRALQHVPYRSGGLTVELVGARGHRAVLRVTADTVLTARAGWRRFLRRYRDSGRSYIAVFRNGLRDG